MKSSEISKNLFFAVANTQRRILYSNLLWYDHSDGIVAAKTRAEEPCSRSHFLSYDQSR
jgi:hypothetical protein